ncbi:MAG: DNA primase [Patescibacteria group bacterium]
MTSFTPVEEIKSRLDIVDIIGEYIKLTPAGSNHKARCPFHNEKTPSFMVSKDKQIYHCFGCAKGGDMFSFVQEMEGIDFPEALRLLAKKANVELRAVDPELNTKRTKLQDANKVAADFFHQVLLTSQHVQLARDYFKERGVTSDIFDKFQLGYSSASWDTLYRYLKQKNFDDDTIFQAGLTIKKERGVGYYDRFRGRIIFPIYSSSGQVIGFGGRVLEQAEGEKEMAKYINSPQTLIYDKSRAVYGLWQAKQAIREKKEIIVVEGYMDVLACHQAETMNVIASSGTALTESQLDILKRHANKLLFSFDQDSAGAEAARRGIELALTRSFEVMMVELPFGKDPDEVIRKDPNAWRQAVTEAKPFIEYYFDQAEKGKDLSKVADKKAMAQELIPLISKLTDQVERTHYAQQLAGKIAVDEDTIREQLTAPVIKDQEILSPAKNEEKNEQELPVRETKVIELIIAIVRVFPDLVPQAVGQIDEKALLDAPIASLYKQIGLYYSENQRFTVDDFGAYIKKKDETMSALWDLMELLSEKEYSKIEPEQAEHELVLLVKDLKKNVILRQLAEVTVEIKKSDSGKLEGDEVANKLIERFNYLTIELKKIT